MYDFSYNSSAHSSHHDPPIPMIWRQSRHLYPANTSLKGEYLNILRSSHPLLRMLCSLQPSSQYLCCQDYHEEPSVSVQVVPNLGMGFSVLVPRSGLGSPTTAPPGDAHWEQPRSLQGQMLTGRLWKCRVGIWKRDSHGGRGYVCWTQPTCENRRSHWPGLCKDSVWHRSGRGISRGPQGGGGRVAQVEQARS